MSARGWRGLRYPDPYVIKYFFKEGMDRTRGSVLELGCGNGNNLRLFRDFGWRTVGIDNSSNALADALGNFGAENASECEFHEWDLGEGLPDLLEEFDVMLMPNVAYYLKRQAFANLLSCSVSLGSASYWILQNRALGGMLSAFVCLLCCVHV